MMKTMSLLSALVALALPVLAEKSSQGFRCENECPLAQQANLHRSYGSEALLASAGARVELTARVERSLARI